MALVSKHYLIAEAIRDALRADDELTAVVASERFKLQKKAWHRGMTWENGSYVVPIRGSILVHENRNLKLTFDTIVAVVWPSNQSLGTGIESELALQERIDMIFAGQGRTTAPATLLALDALNPGTSDQFAFEMSQSRPGDSFMGAAFNAGYDAFASVITVTITAPKRNSAALGA